MILGFGLGISLVIVILSVLANIQRARLKMLFELRPNLLMPSSPLLLIEPKTSLFYFKNPLNFIPDFLSAHGYEVYTLKLNSRRDEKRRAELQRLLQELQQNSKKFHLLFEITSWPSIQPLLQVEAPRVAASWTLMGPQMPQLHKPLKQALHLCEVPSCSPIQTPAFFRFHKKWLRLPAQSSALGLSAQPKDYEELLSHLQVLAEREFVAKSQEL